MSRAAATTYTEWLAVSAAEALCC